MDSTIWQRTADSSQVLSPNAIPQEDVRLPGLWHIALIRARDDKRESLNQNHSLYRTLRAAVQPRHMAGYVWQEFVKFVPLQHVSELAATFLKQLFLQTQSFHSWVGPHLSRAISVYKRCFEVGVRSFGNGREHVPGLKESRPLKVRPDQIPAQRNQQSVDGCTPARDRQQVKTDKYVDGSPQRRVPNSGIRVTLSDVPMTLLPMPGSVRLERAHSFTGGGLKHHLMISVFSRTAQLKRSPIKRIPAFDCEVLIFRFAFVKRHCIVNIADGVELTELGEPDVPLSAPVLESIENP